jgi:hypothetical protein
MSAFLGALRLPHWIGVGVVVAALGGGLPSNWYGLVGAKVSEVERLGSCLQRHGIALASLATSLGDPTALVHAAPSAREHAVHAAERRGHLRRREANAVVACARTVTGGALAGPASTRHG